MPNGNILFKTGVGNFSYNEDVRPHAVTEVENVDGKIPGSTLYTSFNDFGKIQLIEDAGKNLRMNFTYGPDQERWSSKLSRNSMDIRTTVYAGEYEKITERGITREFYYLDGNAIAIREDGTTNIYLAFTDNLGSILSVMNEKGKKVFDASYDAWGQQTVTLNDIDLHRGYTGHEMLTEFDIINMNGRLYDPVLGRFFNPDNYVQLPDNSQSFNRYSYCLNNPLKYTDPTGEFWNLIIGATIGGLFNWAAHDFQYNGNGLKYFAVGALAGAVSAGVASGVNVAMAGGNFWTGAAGLAEGVSSTGFLAGFLAGAAAGASAGFAGGLILGTGNSWVGGSSFGKGLLAGIGSGGIGALEGGIAGGLLGGLDALDKGTNFWTGTANLNMEGALSCKHCLSLAKSDYKTITGKYVGHFEDQMVFESKVLGTYEKGYQGMTLPGRGVVVGDGVFTRGAAVSSTSAGRAMLQHEYGHILQSRIVGTSAYYKVIAIESMANCEYDRLFDKSTHDTFWTETWANHLSKDHFRSAWLGKEILIKGMEAFYYPSRSITPELMRKKFGWDYSSLFYGI